MRVADCIPESPGGVFKKKKKKKANYTGIENPQPNEIKSWGGYNLIQSIIASSDRSGGGILTSYILKL